jgi:hypothetical protein
LKRRRLEHPEEHTAQAQGGGCFTALLKAVLFVILAIAALVVLTSMTQGCPRQQSTGERPSTPSAGSDMSAEKAAALMLNLNGHLCAEVVRITPLKQAKVYEVRCIEYRGGHGTVDYMLDMNTGVGWRR